MKTKNLALLPAVAVILVLTGCPETNVPRDFGSCPLKLNAEEWNGVWADPADGEGMTFKVVDAAKGQLTITFPAKANKEPEVLQVVINEVNGGETEKKLAFFIHFDKTAAAAGLGPFNLIRRPENGVLRLWNLRHDVIEAAVKSGELKGTLTKVPKTKDEAEHQHAQLAADPANYQRIVDAKFWDWTDPGVFVRTKEK
ncbi:MAG: hypothetical protein K1X78_09175 [Verrucomicrobiaceae bacterium]|nr:hypothetical protein [Verrucomicrobiaceae bacterium]